MVVNQEAMKENADTSLHTDGMKDAEDNVCREDNESQQKADFIQVQNTTSPTSSSSQTVGKETADDTDGEHQRRRKNSEKLVQHWLETEVPLPSDSSSSDVVTCPTQRCG